MTLEKALLDNIPDDCIWEDKLVNCPQRYVYQSMEEYSEQQASEFIEWIDDKVYNNILSKVRARSSFYFGKWAWSPVGAVETIYLTSKELYDKFLSQQKQ